MADEVPMLTSINVLMNPRATEFRLVLGDSSGKTTVLRVDPAQIYEISTHLSQSALDASVAIVLGRQSTFSEDQTGHAPNVLEIVDVSPVEVESLGLFADLQTSDGTILRMAFSPAVTEMMRSLFSHQHEIPKLTN